MLRYIVLSLTAAQNYFRSIESSLSFDTECDMSAVQDECMFF